MKLKYNAILQGYICDYEYDIYVIRVHWDITIIFWDFGIFIEKIIPPPPWGNPGYVPGNKRLDNPQ